MSAAHPTSYLESSALILIRVFGGVVEIVPVNTLIVVELDPQLLVEAAFLDHVSLKRALKVNRRQDLGKQGIKYFLDNIWRW